MALLISSQSWAQVGTRKLAAQALARAMRGAVHVIILFFEGAKRTSAKNPSPTGFVGVYLKGKWKRG